MSVDVTKMPKLGFGLMRLPEKDGELDLEQLCKMVDAYMEKLIWKKQKLRFWRP